jgi:hypothetical protein
MNEWMLAARSLLTDRGIYDPSPDLVEYVAEEIWTRFVTDSEVLSVGD